MDAAASTLPLDDLRRLGDDNITAGQNKDVVFGDFGRVQYLDPATGLIVARFGFGGRGDVISSQVVDPRVASISRDLTLGGADIVQGNGGRGRPDRRRRQRGGGGASTTTSTATPATT